MFGLLNVLFRPAGGMISDLIYRHTSSVWAKKLWITFLGLVMGAFELAIGLADPKSMATMFGLVAGLAFFMDASNGANFAVVPHVFPHANGMIWSDQLLVAGRMLTQHRDALWVCRGNGEPWGYHLRHHLPVLRQGVSHCDVDNWCSQHRAELGCLLDQTDAEGGIVQMRRV